MLKTILAGLVLAVPFSSSLFGTTTPTASAAPKVVACCACCTNCSCDNCTCGDCCDGGSCSGCDCCATSSCCDMKAGKAAKESKESCCSGGGSCRA